MIENLRTVNAPLDTDDDLTNFVVRNCYIQGVIDGLWIHGAYQMECYDSTFTSLWDCWADLQYGWATNSARLSKATNSTARFYNFNFILDTNIDKATGARGPEPLSIGPGKFFMYGGVVKNNGNFSTDQNACIYGRAVYLARYSVCEFRGVDFQNTCPGYTNWIIYNPDGATIRLYNCTANTNLVYDPSNGVSGTLLTPSGVYSYPGGTLGIVGSGSGLTNIPPASIVGGWSGIVTNWQSTVRSNREYYANGIVTNVSYP